jgi:hypothetical protein
VKELSFYEQVGVVLPGSIFLAGLTLLFPQLKAQFGSDGLSVGGLGLFLIVAYATGQLIAAAGNFLETIVWLPTSGMPSNWVVKRRTMLLSTDEIQRIQSKLNKQLGTNIEIGTLSRKDWKPHFRHIYQAVMTVEPGGRVLTFNGYYGLNRGLATATLLISVAVAVEQGPNWIKWSSALLIVAAIYVYRMCRSGVLFAREVYTRFLQVPVEVQHEQMT